MFSILFYFSREGGGKLSQDGSVGGGGSGKRQNFGHYRKVHDSVLVCLTLFLLVIQGRMDQKYNWIKTVNLLRK